MSPLHIAAKFELSLFKAIAPKFEDKNPANSYGDTPLLCAVKNGHSDICKYIIDNVEENKKNPVNITGYTPLHYAAMLKDLDIYKLIANNIEDKHPKDNMGTTPFHIAAERDCFDMINFDSETIVKKEDTHPRIRMKIAIVTNHTLDEVIEAKNCTIKLFESIITQIQGVCLEIRTHSSPSYP